MSTGGAQGPPPPPPGWWRASDGNWYPPETHPSAAAVPTQAAGAARVTSPGPRPWWKRKRVLIPAALVALAGAGGALAGGSRDGGDEAETVQAVAPTTTATTRATTSTRATTTTTLVTTTTTTPTTTTLPAVRPQRFQGTGAKVIDVAKPAGVPALVYVEGNRGQDYFGVKGLDADNEQTDLLVNTTDPYKGVRPLDFAEGQQTVRLQVEASGPWMMELRPLSTMRPANAPGAVSGTGDDVLVLLGEPDVARVQGNRGGDYFGVSAHGGSYPDPIVNTTDPYDGEVVVPRNAKVLEVRATGQWTITLS